ncbi:MAG: nucleotidyltransferase domain-containing protein [Candidatus Brockarchaeota archaeon]|nr:nucleotidyltransferase domain-containing protein [Candidatus Brockarchaeota archaeon]
MLSREKLESDLSSLTEVVSSIKEVIAIILFGSVARGNFDEYSDLDLLVVFSDKESMWRRWDELFQKVGGLNLLVHLIPKSLNEFAGSEPTFLNEVLGHGVLLYSKYPFQSFLAPPNFKRMVLIAYSMSRLGQSDKMRLIYRLYGRRRSKGLVEKLGGVRITDGCVLLPEENSNVILSILREHGVETRSFNIYVSKEALK